MLEAINNNALDETPKASTDAPALEAGSTEGETTASDASKMVQQQMREESEKSANMQVTAEYRSKGEPFMDN